MTDDPSDPYCKKEKRTLGVRWTLTKDISLGSIVSWVLVVASACGGVYTYIEGTRTTALTAAAQASSLAEQFLENSKETTDTLKNISEQIAMMRERLVGVETRIIRIESTQDIDLYNQRRLNQRLGIPTIPPPKPIQE